MKDIKLVMIGYGGMAAYHAARLKAVPGYKTVGAYDIDPDRQRAAEADGLVAYPAYEAAAADPSVDAVLIATPNDVHRFYAEYFCRAGKHVICEKPAAMNAEEYESMANVAESCGRVLMVHQNRRWDPDFLTVKKLYETGTLGRIYRIESRVCGANGIPGGWRKAEKFGGGMMLDWGVHLLDQLLNTVHEPVTEIDCRYSYGQGFEVEDGFWLEMKFASGLAARVCVDTNCFVPQPRWIVYGEDGTAVVEDWELNGKSVTAVYDAPAAPVEGIRAGNGFTKTMAYRPHSSIREQPLPEITPDNDAFYRGFYEAVHGAQPCVKHFEVLRVLRLMEACKRSSDEEAVIKGSF